MLKAAAVALIIHFSPGGLVDTFAHRVAEAGHVEIRGVCASACTMFLGARDVCVTRDSRFMFHAAFAKPSTEFRGPRSAEGTAILMAYYPLRLRLYLYTLGGLTIHERWLTGDDLIAMGAARACKD